MSVQRVVSGTPLDEGEEKLNYSLRPGDFKEFIERRGCSFSKMFYPFGLGGSV